MSFGLMRRAFFFGRDLLAAAGLFVVPRLPFVVVSVPEVPFSVVAVVADDLFFAALALVLALAALNLALAVAACLCFLPMLSSPTTFSKIPNSVSGRALIHARIAFHTTPV